MKHRRKKEFRRGSGLERIEICGMALKPCKYCVLDLGHVSGHKWDKSQSDEQAIVFYGEEDNAKIE